MDEVVEEYIPAIPPAFLKVFVYGYEQGKKCEDIVTVLKLVVTVLKLVEPIMEAWAKSHELDEWHCRVEDLLGTAYPSFIDLPNISLPAKNIKDYVKDLLERIKEDKGKQ